MQFNSFSFMWFFPAVVFIYFIIPRKARCLWLLIASYFFYMSWNAKYAVLIGFSTLITYLAAILIEGRVKSVADENGEGISEENEDLKSRKKKLILAGCILVNLLILFFFKYFYFTVDNINFILRFFGQSISPKIDILLPVGISFYTFQALGYIIDVYRGDVRAERNFIRYALFVSFFPQLVAGPIERSKNLISQIDNTENLKLWNFDRVTSGAIVMVWGFFVKMVIADRLALFVDGVFGKYWLYGSIEIALAAILFMVQIYCDFGGYSLIAIGASKIMGIELMENFRNPFFADSVRDFWKRWHISLNTWFVDYVYIPLGGSRKGKLRKYFNTVFVFVLSGLWHGSNWTYVFWGGVLGIAVVLGEIAMPLRNKITDALKIKKNVFSYRFGNTVVTVLIVCFAVIFFRATGIREAFEIIGRLFTRPDAWVLFDGGLFNCGLDAKEFRVGLVALVVLFLVDLVREIKGQRIDEFLKEQNLWFRWLVIIMLIASIIIYGVYGMGYDAGQFIYFRF